MNGPIQNRRSTGMAHSYEEKGITMIPWILQFLSQIYSQIFTHRQTPYYPYRRHSMEMGC